MGIIKNYKSKLGNLPEHLMSVNYFLIKNEEILYACNFVNDGSIATDLVFTTHRFLMCGEKGLISKNSVIRSLPYEYILSFTASWKDLEISYSVRGTDDKFGALKFPNEDVFHTVINILSEGTLSE